MIITIIIYLLAALFAIMGIMKTNKQPKKISKIFPWSKDFKPVTVKFISLVEISVAIGLAGPQLIKTAYQITTWSALAISILMVLAGMYNSRKRRYNALFFNFIILILALMITFSKYLPIKG